MNGISLMITIVVVLFIQPTENIEIEIEWVMQGWKFEFHGFFVEYLGISSALSNIPHHRLVKSSFKNRFDENGLDNADILVDMFPKEANNIRWLAGIESTLAEAESPLSKSANELINLQQICNPKLFESNILYKNANHSRPLIYNVSSPTECCEICWSIRSCLAWTTSMDPEKGLGICSVKGTAITNLGGNFTTETILPTDTRVISSGSFLKSATRPLSSRSPAPKVLIFHGTTCFYQNMTIGSSYKRDIHTIWIGRFMVERADFSHGISMEEYGILQCAVKMDEVWVPTDWTRDIFLKLTREAGFPQANIFVVPEAVDTTLFDPVTANATRFRVTLSDQCVSGEPLDDFQFNSNGTTAPAGRTFQFLSVFKWEHRKGWDVLLDAYWRAFPERSRQVLLRLRTYLPSFERGTKNISAVLEEYARRKFGRPLSDLAAVRWEKGKARDGSSSDFLTRMDVRDLYASADCFVLPSRGEGWGLPIAEAMSMALPVITTNHSGPTAFATPANAYLVPVLPGYDTNGFAIPDTNTLAELMRQVIEDSQTLVEFEGKSISVAARKGVLARQTMQKISPESVVQLMMDRIKVHTARRGWKD